MKIAWFTAIATSVTAIWAKVRAIIKVTKKLKKVKKEVGEFIIEAKDGWKKSEEGLKKLQGFITPDSDGGKKLTVKEVKESIDIIQMIIKEGKQAFDEGVEAKDSIKEIIDEFKKTK
jgi:hypothetical protein